MMSVVPQPDYRPGKVVFISDCAEASSAQEKGHAILRRFESNPAGGQHPNEVSTREKQHVPSNRSHAAQDILGSRPYLGWRFASGAAVAEQLPVRALRSDLCRAATLICSIVPFNQIAIYFGHGIESSQGA